MGDAVGLETETERPDDVAVDGALVERSPVTFVAVELLLDPFFRSSWRFFLSSSLVLRRSSFRSFFLSICFSVKRTLRLGRTLGAISAKRLCPYFAANKIVASKRIARKTRRKRDGIVRYAQENSNLSWGIVTLSLKKCEYDICCSGLVMSVELMKRHTVH